KDGKPVLAVSVAGGDGQDQTTLQLLLDAIDFGLSPEQSVTAPRFGTNHHLGSFRQTPPKLGSLLPAASFDDTTVANLKGRGHGSGRMVRRCANQSETRVTLPVQLPRSVVSSLIRAGMPLLTLPMNSCSTSA